SGPTEATLARGSAHTRHARQQLCHYLVVDRSQALSHSLRGQLVVALAADKHHLIAAAHVGDMGYVYHRLIHAHATYKRRPPTAYQHLTPVSRRAAEAIRVANRQHSDARRMGGDVGRTVANAFARWDLLDLRYLRLEG